MEFSGKIFEIKDTVQVTEKLKKREVWIEMPGNYPQTINVEFVQGNVDRLDEFSIGDEVDVKFSLRGRIYKDKCYNSLQGYSINPKQIQGKGYFEKDTDEPNDDLPF